MGRWNSRPHGEGLQPLRAAPWRLQPWEAIKTERCSHTALCCMRFPPHCLLTFGIDFTYLPQLQLPGRGLTRLQRRKCPLWVQVLVCRGWMIDFVSPQFVVVNWIHYFLVKFTPISLIKKRLIFLDNKRFGWITFSLPIPDQIENRRVVINNLLDLKYSKCCPLI